MTTHNPEEYGSVAGITIPPSGEDVFVIMIMRMIMTMLMTLTVMIMIIMCY